jgi:hypothetical protein
MTNTSSPGGRMFINSVELPTSQSAPGTVSLDVIGYGAWSTKYHKDDLCELVQVAANLPVAEILLVSDALLKKWTVPTTPPRNTIAPAITCINTTTSIITSDIGTWVASPTSWSSQWLVGSDLNSLTAITNVTTITSVSIGFSYTPTATDYGKFVVNSVSATNIIDIGTN